MQRFQWNGLSSGTNGEVQASAVRSARPVVCQLLHGLRVGGAEVLAARLARRLKEHFEFLFVCLDELGTLGQELQSEGFPVSVLGRETGVDWDCSRRLAAQLRRQRVDLIHAHQYTPFFYAATARLLYRRPSLLFTEHGRHYPDYPRRKRMVANRLLLERRDRVVGVGRAVRRALIENEGIPGKSIRVIYNGIDTDRFVPSPVERYQVRRDLGLDLHDFVIMQVARLDPLKDHLTAVRAMELLSRRCRQARLVIVGEGPLGGIIEEAVRKRSLEAHVRFLGLRQDVPRLLAAADVCLLSSISEGIPLTLIEAMAVGLPVVATNVGGVAEVVEDGRTGLLAPHGDHEALARHLFQYAEAPALRQEMGQLGRERAQAAFSESHMHAEYHELYLQMLPNHGGQHSRAHAASVR
jgi:glycosyltransferase involved in cell wall biosynthesis